MIKANAPSVWRSRYWRLRHFSPETAIVSNANCHSFLHFTRMEFKKQEAKTKEGFLWIDDDSSSNCFVSWNKGMSDWKERESLLSKFLTRKHTYHQDVMFLCYSVEKVLLSKIKSAFREIYGRSTGNLREIYGRCLSNISRFSNPLHIDVSWIPWEMLGKITQIADLIIIR